VFRCSRHVPRLRHTLSHSEAFWDLSLPSGTRLYVPEPSSTYRNLSPLMDTLLYPFSDSSTSDHVLTMSPAVNAHSRSRHLLRPSSTFGESRVPPGHCLYFLPLFLLIPSIPSDTFCHSYCHLSVPYTWHVVYIKTHLQGDPYPFLFGSPARLVVHV